MSEKYYADMEYDRNITESAYFAARQEADTSENRKLFRAGFERAYSILWIDDLRSIDEAGCQESAMHNGGSGATEKLEAALREAYQITHYGRGPMQDVDDVLERAIRGSAHNPTGVKNEQ